MTEWDIYLDENKKPKLKELMQSQKYFKRKQQHRSVLHKFYLVPVIIAYLLNTVRS